MVEDVHVFKGLIKIEGLKVDFKNIEDGFIMIISDGKPSLHLSTAEEIILQEYIIDFLIKKPNANKSQIKKVIENKVEMFIEGQWREP